VANTAAVLATSTMSCTKIHDVVNPCRISNRYHWIQQSDGQAVYSIEYQKDLIQVRTNGEDGIVVAACSTLGTSKETRWRLGDSESTDVLAWSSLRSKGSHGGPPFIFHKDAREYAWKRTHNKALGGSSFANMNVKLVDAARGDVLAIYITVPVVGYGIADMQLEAQIKY